MKFFTQTSSLWFRIIIIAGVSLLCFRISTVAYAQLVVAAPDVDLTLVGEDTAEEIEMGTIGGGEIGAEAAGDATAATELVQQVSIKANWITYIGYAYKTIQFITYATIFVDALVGAVKESATLSTNYQNSNQVAALGSSDNTTPGPNAGADINNTGNTNNFTNQLANFNQPLVTPGNSATDKNSYSGKTVNFLSTSANTLIGGNDKHSTQQSTAAQNYVVNASGGGIGLSKPDETWRKNTTPEAIQYNAYYNHVASTQSQSTNALLGLQSSKSTTNPDGTSSNNSPMSQAMGILTFQSCMPNSGDQTNSKNIFSMFFCVVQNVGAMFPAAGYIIGNFSQSATGLLGGINATGASAMNYGVVTPMNKQATDAAAGSEANAYKKSSS